MARPAKVGLDYFPFDVDFDTNEKSEAIMGEFGAKGTLVFIYLLSAIYRKGYFLQWTELAKNSLANRVEGATGELVGLVVKRLVAYGTFDKDLFQSDNVLTSQRIQATYLEATKRRKSQKPTEYWINDDNNQASSEVNVDINPQSKVNESKVNKTKKESKKKTPVKTRKRVYEPDSSPYKLAIYLFEKIKTNNPDAKEPNMQSWANDARKLMDIDKQDKALIRDVIDWCQADSFWSGNILSVSKLRDKFGQLVIQMKNSKLPKYNKQQQSQEETLPEWAQPNFEPPKETETPEEQAALQASLAGLANLRKGGSNVD